MNYLIMKIINKNFNIDNEKLLNILLNKKINYKNKDIYVFVYDFIYFLNYYFLNDINDFLLNKSNNNKNILIIYQNIYDGEYNLKQENLYKDLLKYIKIKFSEIEYILYE